MAKVEALHKYLERELVVLRDQLQKLNSHAAYEIALNLPAMTAEWTRGSKLLAAKASEYQNKVPMLERSQPRARP